MFFYTLCVGRTDIVTPFELLSECVGGKRYNRKETKNSVDNCPIQNEPIIQQVYLVGGVHLFVFALNQVQQSDDDAIQNKDKLYVYSFYTLLEKVGILGLFA